VKGPAVVVRLPETERSRASADAHQCADDDAHYPPGSTHISRWLTPECPVSRPDTGIARPAIQHDGHEPGDKGYDAARLMNFATSVRAARGG
jgi:hypothetical protein